jgi:hypothetical protein
LSRLALAKANSHGKERFDSLESKMNERFDQIIALLSQRGQEGTYYKESPWMRL